MLRGRMSETHFAVIMFPKRRQVYDLKNGSYLFPSSMEREELQGPRRVSKGHRDSCSGSELDLV